MHYLWWIPSTIVWYAIYSWLSKMNNDQGGKWFWIMMIYGTTGILWTFVSRVTKNIIFDGMLYDIIMFATFCGTMMLLGSGKAFTWYQWLGCFLVFSGFVLMKLEFK